MCKVRPAQSAEAQGQSRAVQMEGWAPTSVLSVIGSQRRVLGGGVIVTPVLKESLRLLSGEQTAWGWGVLPRMHSEVSSLSQLSVTRIVQF